MGVLCPTVRLTENILPPIQSLVLQSLVQTNTAATTTTTLQSILGVVITGDQKFLLIYDVILQVTKVQQYHSRSTHIIQRHRHHHHQ